MARNKAYDHDQYHWLLLFMSFLLLFLFFVSSSAAAAAASEADTLLKFKTFLSNDTALNNWNKSTNPSPCKGSQSNWYGVICDKNGNVYGLGLHDVGLMGVIDMDTLMDLHALRSIGFINNSFVGPLPDVKRLSLLIGVYLSGNQFNGEIAEDAFEGMSGLKKVYLARNEFTGNIPSSLVASAKLMELDLQANQFSGKIPDFKPRDWKEINLADNHFEGPIPKGFSNVDATAFAGNKGLCGSPLGACKKSKKQLLVIVGIVVISVAILFMIGAMILKRACGARSKQETKAQPKLAAHYKGGMEAQSASEDHFKDGEKGGELYFVGKDREGFELQELLRAPAEVLGSGSFGSSYKAGILRRHPAMVVKRFRQMNKVGKDDFYDHMRRLGRLSHPNLLPLVAFYYRKEEKLLVHDFVANGSLASHLHAKRAAGEAGLDWPTRLMIIKGVARGLAYLYKEFPGLTVPHGHLKSSNVLLDHTFTPLITEYALIPVICRDHAQKHMAAYKSPEFGQLGRTSKKTDVWSLGILIFELLTGKFPANYLQPGKRANSDLAAWVNSVVREEWTGEVFDKDMRGTKNGEGEMLKLLKIGMCCCESSVEGRWDWRETVDKIEALTERDSEEEDYSSYASDRDGYSSRAVTDDDFSFSVNA